MKDIGLRRTAEGFVPDTEADYEMIKNYSVGTFCVVEIVKPRNPEFHRLFFALLRFGYSYWNPPASVEIDGIPIPVERDFDYYRELVTKMAGHYKLVVDFEGNVELVAKSISFGKMEEGEFRQLHKVFKDVLWKKTFSSIQGFTEESFDAAVQEFMRY
jgi:hypothetical protein